MMNAMTNVTTGYVDLHCHGGGGHSAEDGPDAIADSSPRIAGTAPSACS